ncbi:MAG: hypothetical protein KME60_01890 [Cyanomargarita calcarea GSE-NOS-MK-12-04C]|jgi:hypothetical protein|uniref:Uncharacterized protein n=1 Tax=Cyanomargarita calcarea GSE-NOS-MK-12-04C TaxID=2839659 RepID=A0A951URF9_9CYAN|nr:hypothetical protein [Cyanomargarita calcarea GSE-NOS-MK-12-04C]
MDMNLDFQPGQILCLPHGDRSLYVELIQVIVERQLCWVRPLLLATFTQEPVLIVDMRSASDLLWPISLFRPALDTEVISFLSQVLAKELKSEPDSDAKRLLHVFIQELWDAHHESATVPIE